MDSIKASTYSVFFQENGYDELNKLIENSSYSSVFILVDENTMELCYPVFIPNFKCNLPIEVIEIEAGEIHKNIETCTGIWSALTELNADRKSLVITLGGGVITDIGGFIASTYKRGIDFINIPTTLLAMVDASVGGKTGVDLGVLKNQIGVFANPKMVLIDENYLKTLPKREFLSGCAEVLKYGLTHDNNLLEQLKNNTNTHLYELIYKSIQIKNNVVLEDPKEKGVRKVLNFGHTIGHAIESYFLQHPTKETLTHGEAIAIGMVCECYISNKLLGFPSKKVKEVKELVTKIFGKNTFDKDSYKLIISLLKHDKKTVAGTINFVLLNDIESFKIDCKVDTNLIIESLDFYNKEDIKI